MNRSIRGVLAPVVTPFKTDLSPDRERFIRHCQWLLSQNCGLAPFGTTSEANSMSTDERISLLDALVAARIDPSRMMPGTGCCSIVETVELTAHIRPYMTHTQSRRHYDGKASFEISDVAFQTSVGTKMDAPRHRFEGADDVASIELNRLVLDGVVQEGGREGDVVETEASERGGS